MLEVGPHLFFFFFYSVSHAIDLSEGSASETELRWTKRWRGQQRPRREADGMAASPWHASPESQSPSPPSTSPSIYPPTRPHRLAFLVVAPEEWADWWRETQASQLHLVIISGTPAASPCPLYLLSVLGASLSRD